MHFFYTYILSYKSFILILALFFSCAKQLITQDDKINNITIKTIYSKYESQNWEDRYEAIEELSEFIQPPWPHNIEILLLKATYDNHSAIRLIALQNLAKISSVKTVDRIIEIASEKNSSNERWYALKTLGEYHLPSSVPIFLKALESDDWLIREISIKGLLMIDDFKIKYKMIPYIINALNDTNEVVKITTLDNLNIKENILYEEIIKIFNNNYNRRLKNTLLQATLKALRGYKLDEATRKRVITLLTDTNKDIRLYALKVLKDERIVIDIIK